jgi:Ca2+-transporting ATPase
MEEPPRSTDSSILEPSDWREVGIYGLVIALAVGAGFLVGLGAADFSTERAVTVSFLSLSTARLLHVFNMRRSESGLLVNEISRNPFVWGALGLDIGLLLLAVYVPLLANVLSLTPPGPIGWAIVGTTALLPLLFGQLYLTGRSLSQSDG